MRDKAKLLLLAVVTLLPLVGVLAFFDRAVAPRACERTCAAHGLTYVSLVHRGGGGRGRNVVTGCLCRGAGAGSACKPGPDPDTRVCPTSIGTSGWLLAAKFFGALVLGFVLASLLYLVLFKREPDDESRARPRAPPDPSERRFAIRRHREGARLRWRDVSGPGQRAAWLLEWLVVLPLRPFNLVHPGFLLLPAGAAFVTGIIWGWNHQRAIGWLVLAAWVAIAVALIHFAPRVIGYITGDGVVRAVPRVLYVLVVLLVAASFLELDAVRSNSALTRAIAPVACPIGYQQLETAPDGEDTAFRCSGELGRVEYKEIGWPAPVLALAASVVLMAVGWLLAVAIGLPLLSALGRVVFPFTAYALVVAAIAAGLILADANIGALSPLSDRINAWAYNGHAGSLVTAVEQNNVEAVRRILGRGGDPSAKNKDGVSAIERARALHRDQMLELLSGPR